VSRQRKKSRESVRTASSLRRLFLGRRD
jgi:hypothetical protein